MNKKMSLIADILIIVAAISLVLGIIVRLLESTFLLDITSQAYLQFTQGLLLFAIAIGVRELLKAKGE